MALQKPIQERRRPRNTRKRKLRAMGCQKHRKKRKLRASFASSGGLSKQSNHLGIIWGSCGSIPWPHRSHLGVLWEHPTSTTWTPTIRKQNNRQHVDTYHHKKLACSGQPTPIKNLKLGAGGRRPKALKYIHT